MRILLIDNYDSFTYNLVHYLRELGAQVEVIRNDSVSVADIQTAHQKGDVRAIVISPGPGTPDESGICLELIRSVSGTIPLLGVCLGHQAIGQAFGGKVIRAPKPMHGKVSSIYHAGSDVFAELPSPFAATRYHSLIVARDSMPADLRVTAWTEDDLVMGLAHRTHRTYGVQFHPESIASTQGKAVLHNFLQLARG